MAPFHAGQCGHLVTAEQAEVRGESTREDGGRTGSLHGRVGFLVSRDGAAWKLHDTIDKAIDQAANVAAHTAHHQDYQGFDEHGLSAVVSRPVTVTVERMRYEDHGVVDGRWRTRWVFEAIERRWVGGVVEGGAR
jgi:hypothetical protein